MSKKTYNLVASIASNVNIQKYPNLRGLDLALEIAKEKEELTKNKHIVQRIFLDDKNIYTFDIIEILEE